MSAVTGLVICCLKKWAMFPGIILAMVHLEDASSTRMTDTSGNSVSDTGVPDGLQLASGSGRTMLPVGAVEGGGRTILPVGAVEGGGRTMLPVLCC